jgi:Fe-S-cluster containining protein
MELEDILKIKPGLWDDLKKWMEDYLGSYCINECRDSCCHDNSTVEVEPESVYLFVKGMKKEDAIPEIEGEVITVSDAFSIRKISNSRGYLMNGRCPYLSDKLCSIHDNPDRPFVCRSHPLVLMGDVLILNWLCDYARKGVREDAAKQLESVGKKYNLKVRI